LDKKLLIKQSQHWEENFLSKPEMFGKEPSIAAISAAEIFKKSNVERILELGSGQGRDTLFFAKSGFNIEALDYSSSAVKDILNKSKEFKLENYLNAKTFDVRKKLPFEKETFDGCFSHMLYCMAFSMDEIEKLNNEVNRVLKKGGINIFTVRNTSDADHNNGTHRGEDLYENDGFIVHFFSEDKIKRLLSGFELIDINSFNEGKFPRKLYKVTLVKK
jgi:SAM-dependent methyltransferase